MRHYLDAVPRHQILVAVVFPGWLNPEALVHFVEHERAGIPKEDVALAAYHLGRYVRTWERPALGPSVA
jgi:hypothetical protein